MPINTKTMLIIPLLMLTCSVGQVQAEEKTIDVPPPPALPEGADDDSIKADVVIRRDEDKVVEEFSVNGELYMVRITPKVGKPYYIRYPDGAKGRSVRKELDDINTPFWKLFEW